MYIPTRTYFLDVRWLISNAHECAEEWIEKTRYISFEMYILTHIFHIFLPQSLVRDYTNTYILYATFSTLKNRKGSFKGKESSRIQFYLNNFSTDTCSNIRGIIDKVLEQ